MGYFYDLLQQHRSIYQLVNMLRYHKQQSVC